MELSHVLNILQMLEETSIRSNKHNDSKRLNTDKCLIFDNRNNTLFRRFLLIGHLLINL